MNEEYFKEEEFMFRKPSEIMELQDSYIILVIHALQEERKGWIENYTRAHNDYVDLQQENHQLKDRIEKATKFIESVYDSLENVDRPIFFYENILKILKGEENENS